MIAIIKHPNFSPKLQNIEGNLENLHEIVGGYIKETYFGDNIKIVSNDNEHEQINFTINNEFEDTYIFGVAVFLGQKNGEDCGLSEKQIKKILSLMQN